MKENLFASLLLTQYSFNPQLDATGSWTRVGNIVEHDINVSVKEILAQSGLMTQYQFVSIQYQKNGNRKTRSLLKSQNFSSLSGYSWNLNLQTVSHTFVHTRALSCILG